MTRISDQTFLGKMGFTDPDRHNAIHNAAAVYLAMEKLSKIASFMGYTDVSGSTYKINYPIRNNHRDFGNQIRVVNTIGYIDLMCFFEKAGYTRGGYQVGIEIKKGFTDVANIIQQISTYAIQLPVDYIVCTLYPMSSLDKKILADHDIKHIYVSEESVQKFISKQAEAPEESF